MDGAAPRRFADLPLPQQAGILCNDPTFQEFAATRSGLPDEQFTSGAAAQYLRLCCGVNSRSALTDNQEAQGRFQILRTEFDAWSGRIQAQR